MLSRPFHHRSPVSSSNEGVASLPIPASGGISNAHLHFPVEHRERIRHSNLLERTFGESRRRVKVRAPARRALLPVAGLAMLVGQWRVRWRRWVAAYPAEPSCENCVAFENHAPILILRQPKATAPFAVLWPQAKYYD